MNNQTAIFFDLDDTLIDYEAAFEQASLFSIKALHPHRDEREFFQFFKYYCDAYWSSYEKGSLLKQEYQALRYNKAVEAMGYHAEEREACSFQEQLIQKIPEVCSPFPWSVHVLTCLKSQGIPWGIISNGYSSLQRAKMGCLPTLPEERHIFISEENGFEKPNPDYFRFVQKKTGWMRPVYVGNSYELDIVPAKEAGWRTLWLSPENGKTPIITPSLLASFLTSQYLV
ncbi:HAD family hydrolase [Fictibacillus iocasae]|uniref:HAD family hydrolase n=1 Tax=Fictibacillus iocasae TaxID=2715437 RepID=A0ABW2NIT0_9BACL